MQFLGLEKTTLHKILVYGTVILSQVIQIPPLTRKLTEKCETGNFICGNPVSEGLPVFNNLGN